MDDLLSLAPFILIASAAGYLLGSVPLAYQISKRHSGVDIFEVGTGLPGSSNVLRNVGFLPAVMVFIGDMSKGSLTVIISRFLGVEGVWLLVPAGAAVLGHWNSMFTGFRGGDGLTTLGGSIFALFPVFGFVSLAVASIVALGGQKMPYSSLLSIVVGYGTLVFLNVYYGGDTLLALGIGGLAGLVLAHAILGHRKRRSPGRWEAEEPPTNAAENSG